MKKIIVLLLAIFGFNLTVSAQIIDETIGHVVSFDGEVLHITGEAITPTGKTDVLISIQSAPIYDLLTGFEIAPHNISENTSIRAAYVQGGQPKDAIALWVNWDYDNSAVFSVVVSENIQYGRDYAVFLSHDGKYRITVTSETEIECPYFGKITPADILPEQEYFIWVDMITASSPALVYPERIVMLP